MSDARRSHWESVYGTKAATAVSWYEPRPELSLNAIMKSGMARTDPMIDVGGGTSLLVDELLEAGYTGVTVLDISSAALAQIRARFIGKPRAPWLVQADITTYQPQRQYALWHDRAVFHFLVEAEDQQRYRQVLRSALRPGGQIVIATFGPNGPERCSGLPVARYSAETLSAELGAEFHLIDAALTTHRTPAGIEQQFLYCRFSLRREPGVAASCQQPLISGPVAME
jgi:SAM-dependent methyltransferase